MVNPIYRVKSRTFFIVDAESIEDALTKTRINAYVSSTYNELFADKNEPRGKAGQKTAIIESRSPLVVSYDCIWTVQSGTPEEAVSFVKDNIFSGSKSDDLTFQKEIVEFLDNSRYKYFIS
jgi:hypothetical protein